MPLRPLHTIIVKTTGSRCNLRCSYCFYLNKELQYPTEGVMDDNTLEVLIRQVMEQSGNSIGLVWQGGEPTLAGPGFFKNAVDLMIRYGGSSAKEVSNLLQTNGYSLHPELYPVMSQYNFLVGLSIDGPEDIHDFHRKTPNGKGSFRQVMQTWNRLQQSGIATNILACVTSRSAREPDRMYRFFREHSMDWLQFIPVAEHAPDGKLSGYSVTPSLWGAFMCKIFDLWHHDHSVNGNAPSIRFIENALHAHLGMAIPECTYSTGCGSYLVVEHNGDVFSCDYLVGDSTHLGNIHCHRLFDLLNGEQHNAFATEKVNLPEVCGHCQWKTFCYGGCLKYRDPEGKYLFCESWKQFLQHSEFRIKELVLKLKLQNPAKTNDTLDVSGLFPIV